MFIGSQLGMIASSGVVTVSFTDSKMYSNGYALSTSLTKSGAAIGAAATNRHILVCCGNADTGIVTNSVTIDGNAMTQVVNRNQATNVSVTMFILAWPTGTTATIVQNISGAGNYGVGFAVLAMYGALITAHATASASNGASASNTASIDCPANGAIIGYTGTSGSASLTTWTNLTERLDEDNIATWYGSHSLAADAFASAQVARSISSNMVGAGTVRAMILASFGPA